MKENGAEALIHKNLGRKPVHAITDGLREKIVTLKISEDYKDANFLHYQELLEKHEAIRAVSYTHLDVYKRQVKRAAL